MNFLHLTLQQCWEMQTLVFSLHCHHLMPFQLGAEATAFLFLSSNAWLRTKTGGQWCCRPLEQGPVMAIAYNCLAPTCLPCWAEVQLKSSYKQINPRFFPTPSPTLAWWYAALEWWIEIHQGAVGKHVWHQQSKAAWAFCQQTCSCPLKWLHFLIAVANFSTKNIVFYSCYILSRLEKKERAWVLLPHSFPNCSAARPISLSLKARTLFPSFWQINLVMICPVQFSIFQASTGEQVKIWCMKGISIICWEREWFFQ